MEHKEAVRVTKRLLKETIKPNLTLYLISLVCMIGVAFFTANLAAITKKIVNDVFSAADYRAALEVCFLVIGISFGKSFFQYFNQVISFTFNRTIAVGYQRQMFEKTLQMNVAHTTRDQPSSLMTLVRLYGQAAGRAVTNVSNKLLTDVLTLVGLFVVMLMQDWVMLLVALVLTPLISMLVAYLSKRIRKVATDEAGMTAAFISIGAEAFGGIKTVKSYSLEEKVTGRFNESVEEMENRIMSMAKTKSATIPLMEFIAGLVIGLFVVYAAYQVVENGRTAGEFTALITAFLMAYQPAERVSNAWVALQNDLVLSKMMFDGLDAEPEEKPGEFRAINVVDPTIQFEDVRFAYPGHEEVLKGLNFSINAGESIALVGQSGAGKSTILDLLLKFVQPTNGVVRVSGQSLAEVSASSLRASVALISQDVFLFEGTIRENILSARPDASEEELERAIELSQLDQVLSVLPNGIDARVGPNGNTLSGGQKQRVGVARAVLKRSKILIFDEATSALDQNTEKRMLSGLACALQSATVIYVTHRPSTLEYVDKVLMLDAGEVVGFDTHRNLQVANSAYRHLFNLFQHEEEEKHIGYGAQNG